MKFQLFDCRISVSVVDPVQCIGAAEEPGGLPARHRQDAAHANRQRHAVSVVRSDGPAALSSGDRVPAPDVDPKRALVVVAIAVDVGPDRR
jgi:hypothetical protein